MSRHAIFALSLLPALLVNAQQSVKAINGAVFTPIGCYSDNPQRTLGDRFMTNPHMTNEICGDFCMDYQYFGTEVGVECYCGQVVNSIAVFENLADCSSQCQGDAQEFCGGNWRITMFQKTSG